MQKAKDAIEKQNQASVQKKLGTLTLGLVVLEQFLSTSPSVAVTSIDLDSSARSISETDEIQ